MRSVIVTCLLLYAGSVYAEAEAPAVAPPVAEAETGPKVSVGGQLRLRPEYRNRLKPDAAGKTADALAGQRARATVTVTAARVKAVVEVQDARNWGTEASTVSNDHNADLHQAYLSVPDLGLGGLSLSVGRQEMAYGDERLIGALDWATSARSFDAAVARYAWKGGSVDAIGALVNDRKTAARGAGDVVLSGAYGRLLRGRAGRELDLYALNLGDGASVAGERDGVRRSRFSTWGVRARYAPGTGVQASAEAAYQSGHRGPDAHEAYALAMTAGYVWNAAYRPSLRIEWDRASGDGDPRDGRSREFNNLFPTNHPLYGYADVLGWRNMNALRGTLSIAPRPGQQLSIDYHVLRLTEARGAWKDDAGEILGQDPSGAAGRDVGNELDLLYRFPLRKELSALAGYSAFFPGRFAKTVRSAGTQSFIYGQLLFRF